MVVTKNRRGKEVKETLGGTHNKTWQIIQLGEYEERKVN